MWLRRTLKLRFHNIIVGSELTKEERTCLHRNVRLAFPYLQTETIRSEQEKVNLCEIRKMTQGLLSINFFALNIRNVAFFQF